jgi:hypothetical protein
MNLYGKSENIILRGIIFLAQLMVFIDSLGVAPNPTHFFALMQKSMQKKSRLHLLIDPTAACSLKDK